MILPIITYGNSVLRKVSKEIDKTYPGLKQLVEDMFETMNKAEGVGLAAPQVDRSIRLFVIDGSPMAEDDETLREFKKVFINPKITLCDGDLWTFNEGCLSIPSLREDVKRHQKINIEYFDENFEFYKESFDGLKARIIQHEYDHLEGVLFTDRISPIKKRLIKGKLSFIEKGKFNVNYKVKTLVSV